jgi:hypothetical protein
MKFSYEFTSFCRRFAAWKIATHFQVFDKVSRSDREVMRTRWQGRKALAVQLEMRAEPGETSRG